MHQLYSALIYLHPESCIIDPPWLCCSVSFLIFLRIILRMTQIIPFMMAIV